MDSEGGEKIESLLHLYGLLITDTLEQNLLVDRFYLLSDQVICRFKILQGYDPFEPFPGINIEQAYYIWNSSPSQMRNALLEANRFKAGSEPSLPGITIIYK